MDYIQIIELVAAALGVLYLVLEVKASMWLWRVGVLLPLFYIYISWQSKVYGNIIVNLYFLITSIWGWWLWASQGKTTEDEGAIRSFVRQQRKNRVLTLAALLGGVVALSCALLPLFAYLTDSPYPLLDSIATCCGFVGMWLLAKKFLENWYCWIVSNALYCTLYFLQGFYITAAFFVVYTVLAVVGLIRWSKQAVL